MNTVPLVEMNVRKVSNGYVVVCRHPPMLRDERVFPDLETLCRFMQDTYEPISLTFDE